MVVESLNPAARTAGRATCEFLQFIIDLAQPSWRVPAGRKVETCNHRANVAAGHPRIFKRHFAKEPRFFLSFCIQDHLERLFVHPLSSGFRHQGLKPTNDSKLDVLTVDETVDNQVEQELTALFGTPVASEAPAAYRDLRAQIDAVRSLRRSPVLAPRSRDLEQVERVLWRQAFELGLEHCRTVSPNGSEARRRLAVLRDELEKREVKNGSVNVKWTRGLELLTLQEFRPDDPIIIRGARVEEDDTGIRPRAAGGDPRMDESLPSRRVDVTPLIYRDAWAFLRKAEHAAEEQHEVKRVAYSRMALINASIAAEAFI